MSFQLQHESFFYVFKEILNELFKKTYLISYLKYRPRA